MGRWRSQARRETQPNSAHCAHVPACALTLAIGRRRPFSGAVATRLWLVMVVGIACGDDAAERFEAGELGAEQAAPPAGDCRPVRRPNCSAWNDRACFNVPPECALPREP